MSTPLRILVVDDNQGAANALTRILRKSGDTVDALYDGAAAIERIRLDPPDVVLTDLKMEPVDGLAVLEAARAANPPCEVFVFTAYGAIEVAVRAIRMGARDFLTKPVPADQIVSRIDQLRPAGPVPKPEEHTFIARAPSSQRLLQQLERAAEVSSPVWIEGEVGSGRTYAATHLHNLGAAGPIVLRDTGYDAPWPTSGTVLLPSIDELPEDHQRILVRALRNVPEGLRLIATAEPDARRRVSSGELRPELFYGLAVVVVQIPPLRKRVEDVVPLFERALAADAHRYHRKVPTLDDEMIRRLNGHAWPGNIRELMNLAERMVVMGPDGFTLEEPPVAQSFGMPSFEPGFSLQEHIEHIEHVILTEALRRAGGDRNVAGRILGVERNTLRYKLNKYGLLDR